MQIHGVLIQLKELLKKINDSEKKNFIESLIKQLEMHAKNPEFTSDKLLNGLMNGFHKQSQTSKYLISKKDYDTAEEKFKKQIESHSDISGPYKVSLLIIENAIQEELEKLSKKEYKTTFSDFFEIRKLKQEDQEYSKVLKAVIEVIKLIEKNILEEKTDGNDAFFFLNYYRIRYNCEIILPINQSHDKFLPEEEGDCHGFVLEWGRNRLLGLPALGIRLNQPIPFIPINAAYPDLNHLARVSENVYALQQNQFSTNKILGKLAALSARQSNYQFKMTTLRMDIKFTSGGLLAPRLLELAKEFPDEVFKISITFHNKKSHALGFQVNNDGIHFLDASSAWYLFKTTSKNYEENFENWLNDYLKKTYNVTVYIDTYSIVSYSLKNKPWKALQQNTSIPAENEDNHQKISLASLQLVTSKAMFQPSTAAISQAKKLTEEIITSTQSSNNFVWPRFKMHMELASGRSIEIIFQKVVDGSFYHEFFLKFDNNPPLKIYEENSIITFKNLLKFNLETVLQNDELVTYTIDRYSPDKSESKPKIIMADNKKKFGIGMFEPEQDEINALKKAALTGNPRAISRLVDIVKSHDIDIKYIYEKDTHSVKLGNSNIKLYKQSEIKSALNVLFDLVTLTEKPKIKATIISELEKIRQSSTLDWVKDTVNDFLAQHCQNKYVFTQSL